MARKPKKQQFVPVHRPVATDPKTTLHDRQSPTMWWLLPATGVTLILISGVIQGIQTNRWTESTEVLEAAARLANVPQTIGKWESTELTIPDEQLKQAGAAGYVARVYKNRTTRQEVHVMLLCGNHGPISLHPPTVCFTSAGWVIKDNKRTEVTKAESDTVLGEFQEAVFHHESPTQTVKMKTLWAWNSDGRWRAPDNPRFAFGGSPYLYKIYLSTVLPRSEKRPAANQRDAAENSCIDFAQEFLPLLQKIRI